MGAWARQPKSITLCLLLSEEMKTIQTWKAYALHVIPGRQHDRRKHGQHSIKLRRKKPSVAIIPAGKTGTTQYDGECVTPLRGTPHT